ncbi:CDP-glycerol glycerophosphotransferase family protein [Isoptericola rhizosphaerae]|uniref:CDP-glycerol glycerophosphotransferase family protein n=1 Tax=Isoptericola rhizosphaerae TaxID=3377837 RepID=UPI00383BDEBE
MLRSGTVDQGSLLAEYLGRLSLASAKPLLEAVDPDDGDIDILAFLSSAQLLPGTPEPPWRYRVALVRPEGEVGRSLPIALTLRVDARGVFRWSELRARLPLHDAGDGHARMVIEIDTDAPALRTRRNLRPRQGALISARTVHMRVSGRSDDTTRSVTAVRYLLHTTGDGSAAYITSQSGAGRGARLRWAKTLLKKDAGFIVRGTEHRQMRLLRLARLMTRPFFARRQVWLIGERTDTAQDNGVHLFRHLRETDPRRPVYYVIDRSSPQFDRVAQYGHVVAHSSWRHQLLMLHATVLANAYSVRYLIPTGWSLANYTRHLVWRVGALRVYLKHGIHLSPYSVKRGTTGYDVCLTVMPGETEALRATSGYDSQLVEVGMPRYDALTPTTPSRTLLFMPTWRKYLVAKVLDGSDSAESPYEGSAYERFMTGFLTSSRLQGMLEKYDYRLTFLPHYNMAPKFDGMTGLASRVTIENANTVEFQELLRGCDGFITDFSSVHFDIAYLGTPIVYTQFDREDFEAKHSSPSWFDYERDGFGPVTHDLEGALDAVEEMLRDDCAQDPRYAARIEHAFTHRDRNNCARTVAAIDAAVLDDDIRAV